MFNLKITDSNFGKKLGLILSVLAAVQPALCQTVQLQGQGGQQLSAYAHTIVSFVFWVVLVGIIIMGSVVAWKLTHDQKGWEHMKNWIFGLVFFFAIEAVVAYFLFAAQNSGLNSQGTLF